MEKINKNIQYVIVALLLVILFKTCGTSKLVKREVVPNTNATVVKVDSTANLTVTQEELELMIEIIGYDISYRMLFDNNQVIRTTKRPDDIMNEYVQKKTELTKKLKKVKDAREK
jgi:PBP1b-binding outer membrane lipoprotein LpoB